MMVRAGNIPEFSARLSESVCHYVRISDGFFQQWRSHERRGSAIHEPWIDQTFRIPQREAFEPETRDLVHLPSGDCGNRYHRATGPDLQPFPHQERHVRYGLRTRIFSATSEEKPGLSFSKRTHHETYH